MIAVDTSALLAIVLCETTAEAVEVENEVVISAATLAEALIVAERRNAAEEVAVLVDELGLTIAHVSAGTARQVAHAHRTSGEGNHHASPGGCFAYAAEILNCVIQS